MSTERIEWARAHRGRVWHLLGELLEPYCRDLIAIAEINRDLPPRGGRACPRCVGAVALIQRAVNAALAQESFVTGEPAAPNEYGVQP